MVEREKKNIDFFQEFFTNCDHILHYMVTQLKIEGKCSVLEPCAGHGAFIDKLLSINKELKIDAYDLNVENVDVLRKKYSSRNINIEHLDFLLHENYNKKYDRIIANPPYGAYQTEQKRSYLKKLYPDLYAKETYGIFLIHALNMLKENGKLVFIIPDTFLNLHMHQGLRTRLLRNYQIESLTLFPSKYFSGVNFGYAGLSIISITNSRPPFNYSFPVYGNFGSKLDFYKILEEPTPEIVLGSLEYSEVVNNPSSAFYLPKDRWLSNIFRAKNLNIGDITDVVTGFYSGNDGQYLKRKETIIRGSRKYQIVDENMICQDPNKITLEGIAEEACYIPIVKGGNRRFFKPSEWFMNWSKDAVYDYKVTNKKRARFQNSSYYFKQGLAIPMVSSSAITACLVENRLFDQSIVGVFLNDDHSFLLNYLLGFFNSSICNKIIRTINPSTNNSANYIKKIPIIIPETKILNEINYEVANLYSFAKGRNIVDSDLKRLDSLFSDIYFNASSESVYSKGISLQKIQLVQERKPHHQLMP